MLLASQRHHLLPVSNRNERSARTTGGQMVVLICSALALAGCDQISSLLSGAVKGEASENSNAVEASPDADSPVSDEALDLPKERDGMVLVPAGKFWMGCTKETDELCRPGLEGPRYEVWLDTYYIDKTEVTVDAYRACVTAGFCSIPQRKTRADLCNWDVQERNKHPINCVSQQDAIQFCESVGKRLPTEAQWDKAARGPEGWTFPWGNELVGTCPLAHLVSNDETIKRDNAPGCATGKTAEVGSYPKDASYYGAMDMLGNVREWVQGAFTHEGYDPQQNRNPGPTVGEPNTPPLGRSGCFIIGNARRTRLTYRFGGSPNNAGAADGFRCVSIGTDPPKPKFDIKNPSSSK